MARHLARIVLLALVAPTGSICAEDFKLSDGTLYRGARVVEVRPDALILMHERGIAMADLAKLPKAVQARYNYDPAKAAAYRAQETATQKAAAEDAQRLLAAREARQMELSRAQFEARLSAPLPGESAVIALLGFALHVQGHDPAVCRAFDVQAEEVEGHGRR